MARPERAARLPEDEARVAEFKQKLKPHHGRMAGVVRAFTRRWKARGVETLHGVGIPLRPLFIPRVRLTQLAEGFARALRGLQGLLLEHAADAPWLAAHTGLPEAFFRAVDMKAGVASPNFLSWFRPDGFLTRDRYTVSELNYGNGVIVSIGYTEVLHDLFTHHPVFQGSAFRPEAIDRPFPHWLDTLDDLLGRRRPGHLVLLSHSEEWPWVVGDSPRVRHQVEQAIARMRERGLRVSIAHEADLWVDERGRARVKGSPVAVDLVVAVTIGTSYLEHPEGLRGPGRVLRGAKVGHAPLVKPLAGIAVDKGTLPLMLDAGLFPQVVAPDFQVDAADTRLLSEADTGWVTKDRRGLVLKRGFDGKHTFVGVSTPPKTWAQAAALACREPGYVAQAYVSMPRTEMPVLIDGRHVEWIPVRVELTPFIVHGRFCGALARYAPDAPGLVLSPAPEQMGMTIVCPC